MKNLYYKFLLFVVVAALAAPFILRDREGRPLMSIDQLKMPRLAIPDIPAVGGIVSQTKRALAVNKADGTDITTVYKWRDESGLWHFSDSADDASASGSISETVDLNPDANLVRRRPHNEREPSTAGTPSLPEPQNDGQTPGGLPLRPASGPIERARQVDQLLNDRHVRQQRALDQI